MCWWVLGKGLLLRKALCWSLGGVSIKGGGQDVAPPHQDQDDHGRYQCVIALAKGAFDVWPESHKLVLNSPQHDIEGDDLTYLKSKCSSLLCACEPGDVLIFWGWIFFHGWPLRTSNGAKHAAGKCSCVLPYDRKRKR